MKKLFVTAFSLFTFATFAQDTPSADAIIDKYLTAIGGKEAIAKIIRVFLHIFITATFVLAVLFFLNVSLAFYLNYHYKFADQYEGFGIVGLLNIVLMIVFFFLRPFMARIIEKQIEKQMPSKIK